MKQLKLAQKNETCLLREIALFEVEKVRREFKEENKKFTSNYFLFTQLMFKLIHYAKLNLKLRILCID